MKAEKIVVVGSSNTDMVVKVPHIPAPGETIIGRNFFVIPGGKGANQAVAASRLGASIIFIACVGDDTLGKQATANYLLEGIDTRFIKVVKGASSGVALINVSDDGENSISVASGANSLLFPEDIDQASAAFAEASIVLTQLETPVQTVSRVADLAERYDLKFILNPAPGQRLSPGLLSRVSIITPNETEAALLTGRDYPVMAEIPDMAEALYRSGIRLVIITLGSKGVFCRSVDIKEFIPAYAVEAVDTTAAGDVFNGALAAALASGLSIRETISFAQKAAAISVTRMGAQPSAPKYEEIGRFKF